MQLKTINGNLYFSQGIDAKKQEITLQSNIEQIEKIASLFHSSAHARLHLLHAHTSKQLTHAHSRVRDSIPFRNSFTSPTNVTNTQLHRHLQLFYLLLRLFYGLVVILNVAAFFMRSRSLYTLSSIAQLQLVLVPLLLLLVTCYCCCCAAH